MFGPRADGGISLFLFSPPNQISQRWVFSLFFCCGDPGEKEGERFSSLFLLWGGEGLFSSLGGAGGSFFFSGGWEERRGTASFFFTVPFPG